jgi:hypothetical protein
MQICVTRPQCVKVGDVCIVAVVLWTLNTSVCESYCSGQSAVCSWFIILYDTCSYLSGSSTRSLYFTWVYSWRLYYSRFNSWPTCQNNLSSTRRIWQQWLVYLVHIHINDLWCPAVGTPATNVRESGLNLCTHTGCPNPGFSQLFLTSSWSVIQIRPLPNPFQLITH